MKHLHHFALLLLIILCSLKGQASHVTGGEITWECLGDGRYEFKVALYRDCATNVSIHPTQNIRVWNHPNIFEFPVTLQDIIDITPTCNFGTELICTQGGLGSSGAIEKYVFVSNPIPLSGTPPAQGWIFTLDMCCRSSTTLNLVNPGTIGTTLRTRMFSNNNGYCNDSSPQFNDNPFFVGCAATPIAAGSNAIELDCDSVSYSWAPALQTIDNGDYIEGVHPPPAAMQPSYTFDSPFPGPGINPNNQAATLDPVTGVISLNCHNAGSYVYALKVSSWRNGTLTSEVYRDMQAVIIPCTELSPGMEIHPPIYNSAGQVWVYNDTVNAGDLVEFDVDANALGNLSNNNPPTVTLNASGVEFGAGFTDSLSGCPYLPCATLNQPTPVSGLNSVQTHFRWQTSLPHALVGCSGYSYTHSFRFTVDNGVCPVPGYESKVVNITVMADPNELLPPPVVDCAFLQSLNSTEDEVTLNWQIVNDTAGIFIGYVVYHATNINGPYTAIDTITDINQTAYIHTAPANQQNYYYVATMFTYNATAAESYHSGILTHDGGAIYVSFLNDSGLVQLTALPNAQGTTCEWDFGDGVTGTGCDLTHLYPSEGTYTVTLYVDNGCGVDTVTQTVVVTYVSIDELQTNYSYQIYPNPANNQLFIELTLTEPGTAEVRIIDLLGRVEKSLPITEGNREYSFAVDVAELPMGIHLVEMWVNGQRQVAKFVKE